jgi:protein-S-isoprenylcysteine O-methyltransferase Ste14
MLDNIFYINLIIAYLLLFLTIIWIVSYKNKIWPSWKKYSWQYNLYWWLYYLSLLLSFYLIYLDFNSWGINDYVRYYLWTPFIIIWWLFSLWWIYTLWIINTYWLKNWFIIKWPYFYTRNPQYLGDIVLLIGLILFCNSLFLSIIFTIYIFTFLIMPFSEEKWLEKNYWNKYLEYKNKTTRFF